MTSLNTDHTVRLQHRFAVPIERLFNAWSDPAQLAGWAWGSLGLSTLAEVNFRVGVEFTRDTSGATVELVHTGVPDERSAEGHRRGWDNTLETLARYLRDA